MERIPIKFNVKSNLFNDSHPKHRRAELQANDRSMARCTFEIFNVFDIIHREIEIFQFFQSANIFCNREELSLRADVCK